VTERVLSLAEIAELERAAALGAPAYGAALAALRARWRVPLRDAETATRLLFLIHAGHTEQPQHTGLDPGTLPSAERVLGEAGGEAALPADALFGLGLLLAWQAWPFGEDAAWTATARRWVALAAAREPESRLFREWRFFLREAADTAGPRIYVAPEVHARYHGRGAFGARMVQLLAGVLWREAAPGRGGP
jgi:hypothetical protein